MPLSTAVLQYEAFKANEAVAAISTALSGPLLPLDVFYALGSQPTADAVTGTSTTVTRQVTLNLQATSAAVLTPVFQGESLESVTVVSQGDGYPGVPLLTAIPVSPDGIAAKLKAFLDMRGSHILHGGTGYVAPTVYLQGGLEIPQLDNEGLIINDDEGDNGCVQFVSIVSAGRGYSTNAKVQFEGPLAPGGRLPSATLTLDSLGHATSVFVTDTGVGLLGVPEVFIWDPGPTGNGFGGGVDGVLSVGQMGLGTAATATLTIGLGIITAVTITGHGGPYVSIPRAVVVDSAGSSAVIVPTMGIHSVDVLFGGDGYIPTTHHTILQTPLFASLFGTSVGSASPAFAGGLGFKVTLEQALGSPMQFTLSSLT